MSEKIITYRTLPAAAQFLAAVHNVIARLAASDPANAEWQRDLAVSHLRLARLAEKAHDIASAQTDWQACFVVMDGMKQRGMHLDPPIAKIHEWLAGKFGKR